MIGKGFALIKKLNQKSCTNIIVVYAFDTLEETFGYNLDRTCNEIRATYSYDISCQGTVPESIIAFLESTDYESAIRLTISLRGDADTMEAITGGIAEAYYGGVPTAIREEVLKRLPDEFVTVMREFSITKLKCK
jgi:ADP-ribosyl-[dinitrogen reductase] hydrolase